MPIVKKQLQRLVKFVAMLKENRYPNCQSFARELRKDDMYGNRNVSCTPKTIQRDIRMLREEFNAPIEYDIEKCGYRLLSHSWDFPCPLFNENEMMASVLGARVAEEIFPEPMRSSIRNAVDFQLTTNNPDFLDTAYLGSLIISSGLKVSIDPEVFNAVFEAWKTHKAIDIVYMDAADRKTRRRIEPHVLAFKDSAWFVRGFCHLHDGSRTFAVHRIAEAKLTGRTFEPDADMVRSVMESGPFSYSEVKNVRLICDRSIRKYLVERPLHRDQKIVDEGASEFTLLLPSIWEGDLLQWILYQRGNARLVEPKSFLTRIRKTAEKILAMHS